MGIPIIGFPIIGILKTVGDFVLPKLGKLGKGKATVTGVGLVAGATVVHASLPELAADLQALVDSITALVQAIGVVIGSFGYGRKAGTTLP